MPELVGGFPRAARKSSALFDGLAHGKVWKFSAAEWRAVFNSANSAGAAARYYGKSRNLSVKVVIKDGDVYVRFGEPEPDQDDVAAQRAAKRQARLAGRVS